MPFRISTLIAELVTNVSVEPIIVTCTETFKFKSDVKKNNDGSYLITTENIPGCDDRVADLRVVFPALTQDIIAVRHNLVSSMCSEETDVPFSEIDPDYDEREPKDFHKMTPDYFHKESMRIGELATTATSNHDSMRNTFMNKMSKYRPYLDQAQVSDYIVIVVSPDSVMSNIGISQSVVNLLCSRMKLGMSIETKIVDTEGIDIFRDVDTRESIKLVKIVLSNVKLPQNGEGDIFNFKFDEIMPLVRDPIRPDEEVRAQKILLREFEKTKVFSRDRPEKYDEFVKDMLDHPQGVRDIDDMKRIANVPFILAHRPTDESEYQPIVFVDTLEEEQNRCPDGLRNVWCQAFSRGVNVPEKTTETEEEILERSTSVQDFNKHRIKKWHTFPVKMNQEEAEELSMSGVMAKEFSHFSEKLKQHDDNSHKSFHPEAQTKDIQDFMRSHKLMRVFNDYNPKESYLYELLRKAKDLAHTGSTSPIPDSVEIFSKFIMKSEAVIFGDLISCLMEELAYCKKHWTRGKTFMYRFLKHYRAGMVIHNTGTHVFASFCFEKNSSTVLEESDSRLGPKIYDLGNLWVTDWCSYDDQHIEHFLKTGPYFAALMSHFLSVFKVDVFHMDEGDFFGSDTFHQFWDTFRHVILIYLNGKLDLEELITAQRFLHMSCFDEFNPDPFKFCGRLPEVLRSRLTVYFLKKTHKLMLRLYDTKIEKTYDQSATDGRPHEYTNIQNIFCSGYVSVEQLIDSFYYGYVVSKDRSSGVHNLFAICKKLISEEFKHLKNKSKGLLVLDDLQMPESHRTDKTLLRWFLHMFDLICETEIGENHRSITSRNIIENFSRSTFSDLATLKASAKDHTQSYPDMEEMVGEFSKLRKHAMSVFQQEFKRRPKALESITKAAAEFEARNNMQLEHLIQLLPGAIERLEAKKGFDSDLFSKSQHGGHREIHVLEMDARIPQYFMEMISKTLCGYFKSETITHPGEKSRFVQDHYKNCNITFDEFITFSKSADAKTWCQNHFPSRFAVMLMSLTDEVFHGLIYRTCRLWIQKRVSLPIDLVLGFFNNQRTKSSDPIFNDMRERLRTGQRPFMEKNDGKVTIESGMFQGILHYTSSLYHTMIQEVMAVLERNLFKSVVGSAMIVTKKSGSDDSASLNSVPTHPRYKSQIAKILYRLMFWKEGVSAWLGVINSKEKSLMAAADLVEYNSEWFIRQKPVKPTFRWASACLETNLVETFITRYRIFSNCLTQTVEGGGSTFSTSLIQLSQAWLHYKLLGMDSSPAFNMAKNRLLEFPSPVLGFFPLDPDISAGLVGFDYSVYLLAKNSDIGSNLVTIESLAEVPNFNLVSDTEKKVDDSKNEGVNRDYEGKRSEKYTRELTSVKLSFSDDKLWKKMLLESGLPNLEECIEEVNKDPEIAFGKHIDWRTDRIAIALKMYSPGVKESLSTHSSILRMQIASAYLLTSRCMTLKGNKREKFSLLHLLDIRVKGKETVDPESATTSLQRVFPNFNEFEDISEYLTTLRNEMFLTHAEFTKKSKVNIQIYTSAVSDDYPLISLCKRKWFNKRFAVPVGRTHFNSLWAKAKVRYTFLRDNIEETKVSTGLDTIHLKYFLESILGKPRKISLSDTAAKGTSFKGIVTRIFWPDVKIRMLKGEDEDTSVEMLRHVLFSTATYFFEQRTLDQRIEDILRKSKILKDEIASTHPKLTGLKILHDVITNSKPRELLVSDIKMKRKSVLGFFSIRQDYNKKKRQRTGRGEWRGVIGDISVELSINDNTCEMITLSSLHDHDNTGMALRALMSDLRLQYPLKGWSPKEAYLLASGQIRNSFTLVEGACPINIETDMKVTILENVCRTNWSIRTTPYNIRLVMKEDSNTPEVTLLSEPLTRRDYSKDLGFPEELDGGTMISLFARGESPDEADWFKFANKFFPVTHVQRESIYRESHRSGIYGWIDVKKMRDLFTKKFSDMMGGRPEDSMRLLKQVNKTDKSSGVTDEIAMEFFKQWGFHIVDEDDGALLNVQDLMNADDVINNLSSINIEDDRINEYVEMLSRTRLSVEEMSEIRELVSFGMSPRNPFFSKILKFLSIHYPTVGVKDLANGVQVAIESPWSVPISLMFGHDFEIVTMWSRRDENNMRARRGGDLLSSADDITVASLMKVDEHIRNLEDGLRVASEENRPALEKKLATARANRMILGDFYGGMELEVNTVSKILKMNFLLPFIKQRNLLYDKDEIEYINYPDFSKAHDNSERREKEDMLRYEVNEILRNTIKLTLQKEYIDTDQADEYRQSIGDRFLNESYLDLLCTALQIAIVFTSNDKIFYKATPTMFYDESEEPYEYVFEFKTDGNIVKLWEGSRDLSVELNEMSGTGMTVADEKNSDKGEVEIDTPSHDTVELSDESFGQGLYDNQSIVRREEIIDREYSIIERDGTNRLVRLGVELFPVNVSLGSEEGRDDLMLWIQEQRERFN